MPLIAIPLPAPLSPPYYPMGAGPWEAHRPTPSPLPHPRLRLAGEARQAVRAAGPRHRAEVDFGLAEGGVLGGDDDVAHHCDLAAAAEREAGDRGDDRLPALRHPLPAAGDEVLGVGLHVRF